MHAAHEASARSGETDIPDDNKVENKFITFVNIDDNLYELDSEMDFARPLGPTSSESMLQGVAKAVNELISKSVNKNLVFSAIALVADQ